MSLRAAGCVSAAAILLGTAETAIAIPRADAADPIIYEVTSSDITRVDVEYVDRDGRKLIEDATLPLRIDIQFDDADSGRFSRAQLRADWRKIAAPARWVTVKISQTGHLLCENTLDVGNVACYANTPHVS